jgi:signal transduction histidine kinase
MDNKELIRKTTQIDTILGIDQEGRSIGRGLVHDLDELQNKVNDLIDIAKERQHDLTTLRQSIDDISKLVAATREDLDKKINSVNNDLKTEIAARVEMGNDVSSVKDTVKKKIDLGMMGSFLTWVFRSLKWILILGSIMGLLGAFVDWASDHVDEIENINNFLK